MGVGANFGEAYAKAQRAASVKLPQGGVVFISIRDADKPKIATIGKDLINKGFQLVGTQGTARVLNEAGIACERVFKVSEGRPNIVDMIKNGEVHFIINTTEGKKAIADSFTIRRQALQQQVTYTTTLSGAWATCLALDELNTGGVNRLQDLHKNW
jgi:carbamoyl-phosphate synthase large subunit